MLEAILKWFVLSDIFVLTKGGHHLYVFINKTQRYNCLREISWSVGQGQKKPTHGWTFIFLTWNVPPLKNIL